jgi:hypothetical protein
VQFTASDENINSGKTRADALRSFEKKYNWVAKDWHFKLLQVIEPHEVHAWFGHAHLNDGRLHFNAGTKRGTLAYDWVKSKYERHIFDALGPVTLCLSKDRQVLKAHNIMPPRSPRGTEGKPQANAQA